MSFEEFTVLARKEVWSLPTVAFIGRVRRYFREDTFPKASARNRYGRDHFATTAFSFLRGIRGDLPYFTYPDVHVETQPSSSPSFSVLSFHLFQNVQVPGSSRHFDGLYNGCGCCWTTTRSPISHIAPGLPLQVHGGLCW